MRPVPIVFHLGPLSIHTYGIGLGITFLFGLLYLDRRLRASGLSAGWLERGSLWIFIAAMVGARLVHVVANAGFYAAHPVEIPLIWHGGLSSFGGLLLGVPTGLYLLRRELPELSFVRALDLAAPVLMASWGLGRLLGPQLMIRGGGRPTTAWYGMYYAGQVGRRIPAPIFQSIECFAIFGLLVLVERRFPGRPEGLVVALAAGMWGLSRFADQFFLIAVPRVWDAVEVAGLVLAACGWIAAARLVLRRFRGPSAGGTRAPAAAAV